MYSRRAEARAVAIDTLVRCLTISKNPAKEGDMQLDRLFVALLGGRAVKVVAWPFAGFTWPTVTVLVQVSYEKHTEFKLIKTM